MEYTQAEILQTVRMTEMEHLDIRTVTLGLSLRDCGSESVTRTADRCRAKILRVAERLVKTVDEIGDEVGIRSSFNVARARGGINMDAGRRIGVIVKDAAERTRDQSGIACAKFVCFANAVEDNPFMAGAFHGVGEPEAVINVGVSGPGVV